MQESKEADATHKFFMLASCARQDRLNVGFIFLAAEKQHGNRVGMGESVADLSATVAANLQSQLLALWYDKVVRCKTAERFRKLVSLCHCGILTFFAILGLSSL